MKQYVTIEQVKELTAAQFHRLGKLWEPRVGDVILSSGSQVKIIVFINEEEMHVVDSWGNKEWHENKDEIMVLPSIGQMIAMLRSKGVMPEIYDRGTEWYVGDIINSSGYTEAELCDTLWELLKETL